MEIQYFLSNKSAYKYKFYENSRVYKPLKHEHTNPEMVRMQQYTRVAQKLKYLKQKLLCVCVPVAFICKKEGSALLNSATLRKEYVNQLLQITKTLVSKWKFLPKFILLARGAVSMRVYVTTIDLVHLI